MSFYKHEYHYYSDIDDLLRQWGVLLKNLIGNKILAVYGVWDNVDNSWFDDASMVVLLDCGNLTVNEKCDSNLSLGWNDMDIHEKPIWFDAKKRCRSHKRPWMA